MNPAKTLAISFFVAIGIAHVVLSAGAEQPTPLPHVQIGMPVTPPRGWNPKMWADIRAHCQGIADRAAAHLPATRQEILDGKGICMTGAPRPPSATQQVPQSQPTFGDGHRPTPVPPSNPQSSAAPRAAAPRNPYWCAGVPASPPPPKFSAEVWASIRHMCTNNASVECMHECEAAMDLWERRKAGDFDHPPTSNPPATPTPLKHSQVPPEGGGSVDGYSGPAPAAANLEGPFPLPRGAKGFIMHMPHAATAAPTLSGPQGRARGAEDSGSFLCMLSSEYRE